MDKTLISIDYLIINLQGDIYGDFPESSHFSLLHHEYGTKIFARRSDLYFHNEKIGSFMADPRSEILSKDFAQLQFENHLFYTKSLNELNILLSNFCQESGYSFKSINRLDICIDKNDRDNSYRALYDNIIGGSYLISGRPKNIQSYFETFRGKSVLNGFAIGKRTSSKLLRVYNKTLSLQLTEKPYINDYYQLNDFENNSVWRFEYQLNSKFFSDMKRVSNFSDNVTEQMTWGIFNVSALFELLKLANKGFFEIHENTGKKEINKEIKIEIFDFDSMRKEQTNHTTIISKLKKVSLSTTTIKKRLAKSLFREYYANGQDISYIIALNLLLEDIDLNTDKPLSHWFKQKVNFYLFEFRTKEKLMKRFDTVLYNEHQQIFL